MKTINEKRNTKLMYSCDSWRKHKRNGIIMGYGPLYSMKPMKQYNFTEKEMSIASIFTMLFR